MVVGRAGIGLDNVDVAAATRRGVLVVNAGSSSLKVTVLDRHDEISAELELDRMQSDLSAALASRARLAALGEAVAKINHDLRNMLTSAQIASERLAMSGDPSVAAALASIRTLKADNSRRAKLFERAETLKQKFQAAGLPVMESSSHIIPLMIGDAAKATAVSMRLIREFGMYATPINYPTVPRGTERLRFTPGPKHTDEQIRCSQAKIGIEGADGERAMWTRYVESVGDEQQISAGHHPRYGRRRDQL